MGSMAGGEEASLLALTRGGGGGGVSPLLRLEAVCSLQLTAVSFQPSALSPEPVVIVCRGGEIICKWICDASGEDSSGGGEDGR